MSAWLAYLTNLLSDSIMGTNSNPSNYMLTILIQQLTGLPDGDRLDQFVSYVSTAHPEIASMLQTSITAGDSSSKKADLIASMSITHDQMIQNDYRRFEQVSRDTLFDGPNTMQDMRLTNRLRARYFMPGDDVGRETVAQTASDLTQVSLFQYQVPNADAGGNNNSIYLDSRRNDHMRFSGQLGLPRPPNREMENTLPFPVLSQYQSDQPLRSIARDKLVTNMATRVVVKKLGHTSVGLMDQIDGDILEPVIQLPGFFRPTSMVDTRMRSWASSWRDNNEPVMTGDDTSSYDENFNPNYRI